MKQHIAEGSFFMDGIIVTAAVILAVIALMELVTLFAALPGDGLKLYISVLPVFGEDGDFSVRLEQIMRKGCGRKSVILVDFSADDEQRELCRQFARDNPDCEFVTEKELAECLEKKIAG